MGHRRLDPGDLAGALRARLEREGDVVVAYLSVAPCEHAAGVEVAVLLAPAGDGARQLHLRAAAVEAAGALEVEVTLLNDASVLTAYRVVTEGRLLLSDDEDARARFERDAIERYFELAGLQRMLATGLRHRIASGGFGSG